jgi:NADH-quinone oxidoreductase subunit C
MNELTPELVVKKITDKFGDKILEAYETYGITTLTVDRDINIELSEFIKTDEELNLHFLKDLCGIHYPDKKDQEIGVIYLFYNMMKNFHLRVQCFFPIADANIRSMVPLWKTANWLERETYDFFGINFIGHPDLRRIMNVDDMDYHPLLKQYPLEDATREDKDDRYFGR